MTEQNTKNTPTSNGTMCDCGPQHPRDELNSDGSTTKRAPEGVNASNLLRVLGLVALLEGCLCLVAAYVDQTWGVLPTDPLTILGAACMMAGLLLTAGGLITYPSCREHAKDPSRSGSVVDQSERRSIPTPTSNRQPTEAQMEDKKDR